MNLASWLARIERLHPAGIELGLERVGRVAAAMGLLPLPMPAIVVAGTNGKGSTVALLDALARAAGYRTAVYTSPHLQRFNERLRLDGVCIDDDSLCHAFDAVEAARDDVPLTYFEFTTLAILSIIHQRTPDLAILEVGLGGRLDAVNLVDADVAVITSIGLDHTDWLGDTLEKIAVEKAGIRRPGRPLLFAASDMPAVIAGLCDADAVPLRRAGDSFGVQGSSLFWQTSNGAQQRCEIALPVALGEDNLAVAVQALALLDRLDATRVADVAATARLSGRAQRLVIQGVEWLLDVGHNREALERFLARLPPVSGETVALVGMLADKPAREALAPFVPQVTHWLLAGLAGQRGQDAASLRRALPASVSAAEHDTVGAAVVAARQRPGVSRVLVFGSFHTVAEAADALAVDLE